MPTFKKLIEKYFQVDLEESLHYFLKENVEELALVYYKNSNITDIDLLGLEIIRVYIHDHLPDELQLTIQVRMNWLVSIADGQSFKAYTPWANLETYFRIDEASFHLDDISFDTYKNIQYGRPLDDYLVPVISREKYDHVAESYLEMYYPEVLNEGMALDPHVLANRLGLVIKELPLGKANKIRGQVYFRDADIYYSLYGTKIRELIPKGTIVINDCLKTEKGIGAYNFTIVHECVHWLLHQKAAWLANLVHSNKRPSFYLDYDHDGKSTHSYMESQANGIASSMMIPKSVFVDKLESSQDDYLRISRLLGQSEKTPEEQHVAKMEWAIQDISSIYKVSITSAKIRAIDLGYEAVMGVLNYVDGAYLKRFSFSKGSLSKQETFSLKQDDFLKLVQSSQEMFQCIRDREYIYLDSHVVKNDPKYIEVGEDGEYQLTQYAQFHMDEACLIFRVRVATQNVPNYSFYNSGILYHREDTALSFQIAYPEATEDRVSYIREEQSMLYDILSQLPNHFPNAITMVMDSYGYTQEEMAEMCDLSVEKLRELKNRDDVNHSLDTLMQFFIGMKLPPHLSFELLNLSGQRLTNNRRDLMYKTLLYGVAGEGLFECNAYLIEQGHMPLGKTAKAALQSSG